MVWPSCGPTRTEAAFVAHVQRTVASDRAATTWHFVVDNLNTHCAESLVRYVAAVSGVSEDLGEKGDRGILRSLASRAAFLRDPEHRVVFHDTPKHAASLNQVEIWLGILVRKLLRRGSFTSTDDLQAKVLAFIDYFNRTMAKPFEYTYQGKPLHVWSHRPESRRIQAELAGADAEAFRLVAHRARGAGRSTMSAWTRSKGPGRPGGGRS